MPLTLPTREEPRMAALSGVIANSETLPSSPSPTPGTINQEGRDGKIRGKGVSRGPGSLPPLFDLAH